MGKAMTTNQTIDGVPVFYAIDPLDAYPEPVGTDDKIERSNGALWVHLNGKRSKLIGLQSLDFLINQLVQIKGEVFGTEPAAQPQGEPVAWRYHDEAGISSWFDGTPEQVNLEFVEQRGGRVERAYAEQPAPVAVMLPEREAMRDIIAQAIGGDAYDCTRVWSAWGVGTMSDDDFIPIADQEERLYEIADACLDEVTRLNGIKP